jgi:hypothetical protein
MPTHTQSKSTDSASTPKKIPVAGGAGARSQATGRPLGKAGIRGLTKNAECVENYLRVCLTAPAENVLKTALAREYLMLARVTRTVGGGRVVVQLLDGTADVSVPIGGSIKMKGRAATKTDRSNCMCQGDIVVVRGAQASGKVSAAAAAQIRTIFDELSVSYPKGFFTATGPSAGGEAVDDEFAYEWDRSDQAARETAAVAAARALAARKSAMRAGETVAEEAEVEAEVDIEAI